ncbi:MAG: radical SAM protein [Proteobacteria bacterium]|nr:radical SAM protein [Pseudomonadota bacterium]
MVEDRYGRRFQSLRLSITGDCNLACTYCVPAKRCVQSCDNDLPAGSLFRAVQLLTEMLGIEKIRLTGGEPLISPKLEEILPRLAPLSFQDISLTTNAQLLKDKVSLLKNNGIGRINISLDTLDPAKFNAITRGGDLRRTLDGIEEALKENIRLKINMVPVRDMNEDEVLDVLDFCLDRDIELRYIELMQMGHLTDRKEFEKKFVPVETIFEKIHRKYTFETIETPVDSTANRYAIEGRGDFGVIANDSAPFCRNCNRLRLSSEGILYGCLSSTEKFPIGKILELPDDEAVKKLEPILTAALATKRDSSFDGSSLLMRSVGG